MKPREFLDIAHKLSRIDTEAAYRSAISRAYYAAFHKGSEALKALGITLRRSSGGHEDVYLFLQNSGAPHMVSAAAKLNSLRSMRVKADYYLDNQKVGKPLNVFNELSNADKIMQSLEAKISSSDAKNIKTTIQDYRTKSGR